MAGLGPTVCLDTLVSGAGSAAGIPASPAWSPNASALDIVASLRREAERRVALGSHASRFTDIALDALGLSALEAFGAPDASPAAAPPGAVARAAAYMGGRLHDLARLFIGDDIDRCFQYFVARDIGEFVGTGSYPTVGHAQRLTHNVATHCKKISVSLAFADHEGKLHSAISAWDETERLRLVQGVLADAIDGGLCAIAAAPSQHARSSHRAAAPRATAASDDEDASGTAHGLALLDEDDLTPERRYLPVFSLQAAAGYFGLGEDVDQLGYVEIPTRLKAADGLFVAQVVGQSMEPTVPDGSYAVFRAPVIGSRQGKIVLAQKHGYTDPDTGGSYTVKRYESTKQVTEDSWQHLSIRLVPENPDYDVIEVDTDAAEELMIIAELVTLLD